MRKLLELLGMPTTNAQGHELGCFCEECKAARDAADGRPFKPGSLGAVLQEAAQARKDKLH